MTEPVQAVTPETTDAATAQPAEGAEQPAEAAQPKLTDTVEYWRQRARQNEQQAKANADAAKELAAIKDRDLSELQRAQKQAAETAGQLAELQRQNILLSKGISADLTPPGPAAAAEEWAVYADRLLAWKGNAATALAPIPTGPKPDMSQGAQPIGGDAAEAAAYEAIKAQNWGYMTNQTRK